MILVSFGLWFIVVFGFRLAVFGNPLYTMAQGASPALLKGVDALFMGERAVAIPEEVLFVRRFTRNMLLQLAMLLLEVVLLLHLWWIRVLPVLAVALLAKDLLGVATGVMVARRDRSRGLVTTIAAAPPSLLFWERVGAAVSACGALIYFLTVNGMRPW